MDEIKVAPAVLERMSDVISAGYYDAVSNENETSAKAFCYLNKLLEEAVADSIVISDGVDPDDCSME